MVLIKAAVGYLYNPPADTRTKLRTMGSTIPSASSVVLAKGSLQSKNFFCSFDRLLWAETGIIAKKQRAHIGKLPVIAHQPFGFFAAK
jgi:hypothetical protein